MKLQKTVLAISLALAGTALAQERPITRKQLPPAVDKAVSRLSKDATLRGLTQETENGCTFYEAELMVNGHTKDILMDGNGNPVEVEEEVALKALPAAVQHGLQERAGGGTITKVESLTKRGKLVAYEAAVKNGSKRSEVQVGPDGKKLARPQ